MSPIGTDELTGAVQSPLPPSVAVRLMSCVPVLQPVTDAVPEGAQEPYVQGVVGATYTGAGEGTIIDGVG